MSRSSEADKTNRSGDRTAADRTAFVARLHTILQHWPSADRLARATGVSPSAFRKWLKGEAEPSRERLVALAVAASVGIGWLATGEGPEPRFQTVGKTPGIRGAIPRSVAGLVREDFVLLPKRPEAAAAGVETPVPPAGAEFIALRNDWVRSVLGIDPDRLRVETAVGESMLPGIQHGDLLFVDTSESKFGAFGVYVLEIGGERLVKRVQPKLDGSLTLISDNTTYETEHLLPAQAGDVHVIGRVLWICGPLRGSGKSQPQI
jgi:phage repressor protein C with HTH and peptisase S24 domain